MSKELVIDTMFSGEFYRCDICKTGYLTRVLTDSYSGLDICLDCASGPADHGLFWQVTQDPEEDEGDNLLEVAARLGLFCSEDEEDDDE
jgi:hypothetical protein